MYWLDSWAPELWPPTACFLLRLGFFLNCLDQTATLRQSRASNHALQTNAALFAAEALVKWLAVRSTQMTNTSCDSSATHVIQNKSPQLFSQDEWLNGNWERPETEKMPKVQRPYSRRPIQRKAGQSFSHQAKKWPPADDFKSFFAPNLTASACVNKAGVSRNIKGRVYMTTTAAQRTHFLPCQHVNGRIRSRSLGTANISM